ncbi:glia maturation factor gamma-like [Antedon mediterranea]|uniref:glia maturation factor gamma-like n=1 Tax=Antedon mediterranea TaxID=105859 RepID=UPI003AF41D5E
MSTELKVCTVDPELLADLNKLRFTKESVNMCMILKIEVDTQTIKKEKTFEDVSPEDIHKELPAEEPRYVVYKYTMSHEDGRISYPLIFSFISPSGCKPELQMMYAGSKHSMVNAGGFTKVFDLRCIEEITEEWLLKQLK